MNLRVDEVEAQDLKPGELFSFYGPQWWARVAGDGGTPFPEGLSIRSAMRMEPNEHGSRSVGEVLYLRTEAPVPPGQEHDRCYRITVLP